MKLRPYQKDAINSIKETNKKTNKILISLATGLGKTVVFSEYIKKYSEKKVLILAHRKELLTQAKKYFKNKKVFLEQGENKLSKEDYNEADIIIASVQSLNTNRIYKYNPNDFDMVIIDESHHSYSKSYKNILRYFGLLKEVSEVIISPQGIKGKGFLYQNMVDKTQEYTKKEVNHDWNFDCLLLGVTATPIRNDKSESLREIFDTLGFKYGMADGIKENYLSNIKYIQVKTNNKFKVKTNKGDYNSKDLSKSINNDERNKLIVDTYLKYKDKPCLVFAVDIKHAKDLTQEFLDNNINAKFITGKTSKEKRDIILDEFENNKLDILINVEILTEGYDNPDIRTILLARPTKSLILATQMIGRGTRLAPEKEYVTIIDFVDNIKNNNPLSLSYILDIPEAIQQKRSINIKKSLNKYSKIGSGYSSHLSKLSDYEIIDKGLLIKIVNELNEDSIKDSKYNWYKINNSEYFCPLPKFQKFSSGQVYRESKFIIKKGWEQYSLYFSGIKENKSSSNILINVFYSINDIDTYIDGITLKEGIETRFMTKGYKKWKKDMISDKQVKFIYGLLKNKKYITQNELKFFTKGDASNLINLLLYYN